MELKLWEKKLDWFFHIATLFVDIRYLWTAKLYPNNSLDFKERVTSGLELTQHTLIANFWYDGAGYFVAEDVIGYRVCKSSEKLSRWKARVQVVHI